MSLTCAGLWRRVVARIKLKRFHAQFARPTAGRTLLKSKGGAENKENTGGGGEGGGKGHGGCATGHRQNTQTGYHNDHPPTPHTATSHAVTRR